MNITVSSVRSKQKWRQIKELPVFVKLVFEGLHHLPPDRREKQCENKTATFKQQSTKCKLTCRDERWTIDPRADEWWNTGRTSTRMLRD